MVSLQVHQRRPFWVRSGLNASEKHVGQPEIHSPLWLLLTLSCLFFFKSGIHGYGGGGKRCRKPFWSRKKRNMISARGLCNYLNLKEFIMGVFKRSFRYKGVYFQPIFTNFSYCMFFLYNNARCASTIHLQPDLEEPPCRLVAATQRYPF